LDDPPLRNGLSIPWSLESYMHRVSHSSLIPKDYQSTTPVKKSDEAHSAETSPPALCSFQFVKYLTVPLETLFHPENQDLYSFSQENKLHAWFPTKDSNLSVNTAVASIPIESPLRQQALKDGMQQIFQAAQPDLEKISHPPQALVVPLGLHPLNAVRITALQNACNQLLAKYGPGLLQSTHIYFIGGRKLLKQEKALNLADVMNFGLNAYCQADWTRLSPDRQQDFLTHFVGSIAENLGEIPLLPEHEASIDYGETDSAKHLWANAGKLGDLREIFDGRVHYIESVGSQYKSENRDSTHGNALLFLENYLTKQKSDGGEKTGIWVCSDSIFCPRASLIFQGYCNQYGVDVTSFSSPLPGHHHQMESLPYLLPLMVRESACMVHEIEQYEQRGGTWFEIQQLSQKIPVPQ
jgi:hypothetical protein